MLKKLYFPLLALFMLAGCAASNNSLNIAPRILLPPKDPTLQGITISINSADLRQENALAKVNRDGHLITLTPSRDVRFLLLEVLEKQMAARGYMIGANGSTDLQIVVHHLFADVTEGNFRYSITTKADISIIASAKNGNKLTKNYHSVYREQGAFSATNEKITHSINNVLNDAITDMARDNSINEFIKQNSR